MTRKDRDAKTANELLGEVQEIRADIPSRVLYLMEDVDSDVARFLAAAIHRLGRDGAEPVTMYLNSLGGSFSDGMALHDLIRSARFPTTIVGVGAVMSMAVLILQAGHERCLMPGTRLLLHNGSWNVGDAHSSVIVASGKEQEAMNRRYSELLAARSKNTVSKIQGLCAKETYLSAEQALKLGLADRIEGRR